MPTPEKLRQKVEYLKGIGSSRAALLRRLKIETVEDVFWHLPRHYEEFSGIKSISQLVGDQIQTVCGEVVQIEGRDTASGKTIISIVLSDNGKHVLEGVWFNQPWVCERFRFGQQVAFTGKAKWYRDHWQMSMPKVQEVEDVEDSKHTILPVYALTEDLRMESMRAISRKMLDQFADDLEECLPEYLRETRHLPGIAQAMRDIHFPPTKKDSLKARRRLVYEEFLILQLALAVRRRELRYRQNAPILRLSHAVDHRIRRLFPFDLTDDQNIAIREICRDLHSERPMQRLLQADVGAGKTAVAAYALLVTVANQYQAVLMAPTEVLARQHFRTLDKYLAHSQVRRVLLTGSLSPKHRRIALAEIATGHADLIIGTQALVQDAVQFAKLGLVVIDEQHKFGVNQRARMKKMGLEPHYLIMTATPIPRTVSLTIFGDLDISTIKQLPPGRQPVETKWVQNRHRALVYEQLTKELKTGKQLYVVCPLVEESETLDLKAAEQVYQELQAGTFKEFRVGLLHGRMDERSKDAIMQQFRDGNVHILVSTVVIEVGVDVANATLMIIEHADRFGLSQLHQLRGRVSRGPVAGRCFLFADEVTADAKQRLRIMTKTTDGFVLAEEDARIRGLGEFFGTRQHGIGDLRIGNLTEDRDLLQLARYDAFQMVKDDPGLKREENRLLRQSVLEKYGSKLDLAQIG